jgi:pimeloyl-ACP methyl ester carboxylesterase
MRVSRLLNQPLKEIAMKRILWLAALILVQFAATTPALADHSPLASSEVVGVSRSAQYAMFLPAAWNGRLVLYAHGFIDPDASIALPDVAPADVAPWVVELRETLLAAGYAVAYSSYAENGWAVKDGAERTHELRELFTTRFGVPSHVYVMGRSLGALITVMLAEKFPGAYQGGLALCGPVGGGKTEIDYVGHVRVLFDYFYPGVIPGDAVNVPPMEFTPDSPLVQAIIAAILADPASAVALASADQAKLPYTTPGQLINSIVRVLGYHVRGTNDLLARTGGQVPFGNVTTRYSGLGLLVNPSVNAGVQRVLADDGGVRYLDDYYRPRGNLMIPVLTLHTTMDPDVPFSHEAAFAKAVATAKRSQWLAQQHVVRYGHCNVSPAEVARTLSRLVNWAENKVKPASGDVTVDFAAAFPGPTITSQVSATTSELTATIEAILSTTGFSLP